ncbi:MAG: hypothetical protein AB1Z98_19735 [Nannocystaceae bacterium]
MNTKTILRHAAMMLSLGLTTTACDAPESSRSDSSEEGESGDMEDVDDDAEDPTAGADDDGADDDGADGGGAGDDEPTDADPACGDGVVDPDRGEDCDDGNVDELDGCRLDCSFGPTDLRLNYEVSTPLEIRGGPEGIEFDAECPAGEVIVGMSGRSGATVDQLQVQCGAIGLISPELGWIDISVGAGTAMETHGGSGGGAFWLQCPEDHVVVGFGDRSNGLVEMVSLRCAALNLVSDPETGALSIGFGPAFTTGAVGGQGVESMTQLCPAGEVAASAQGRSEGFINAFGMTCRPLQLL